MKSSLYTTVFYNYYKTREILIQISTGIVSDKGQCYILLKIIRKKLNMMQNRENNNMFYS